VSGKILGISGPTVSVDLKGLKLYERVYVGKDMLTGEVVRIEKDRAVIQIYEDTRGLAAGEPVKGVGMPLTVRLGPGLLGGMFDGLQRPLERLKADMGPFITGGKEMYALDYMKPWNLSPLVKQGDAVTYGSFIGTVDEGAFKHYILDQYEKDVKIARVVDGEFSLNEALGEYDDGREITGCNEWPVRLARPYRRKFAPAEPLVTGQRSIDFLFPLARGGTAIIPGGFGTGKTILEQAVAKFADVDIVVYVGCGERGNEMADMIAEFEELRDPWTNRPLREKSSWSTPRTCQLLRAKPRSTLPLRWRNTTETWGITCCFSRTAFLVGRRPCGKYLRPLKKCRERRDIPRILPLACPASWNVLGWWRP
jgi:V/A-type H+-transporting ATPase subunit A